MEGLKRERNHILLLVIKNFPCNKILSLKAQLKLSKIISPCSNSSSSSFVEISFNFFNSSSFIFSYGFSIFVNSVNLFRFNKSKLILSIFFIFFRIGVLSFNIILLSLFSSSLLSLLIIYNLIFFGLLSNKNLLESLNKIFKLLISDSSSLLLSKNI